MTYKLNGGPPARGKGQASKKPAFESDPNDLIP